MKEKDKEAPLIEEDSDSYGKNDNKSQGSFDENKLTINANNEQLLSNRKEMLQDFKKISAQVSDLSKTVVIELKKQGDFVNRLEDRAKVINENAKNVKNETKETDVINEKNIKKSIWTIVIFVVILAILIICGIITLTEVNYSDGGNPR